MVSWPLEVTNTRQCALICRMKNKDCGASAFPTLSEGAAWMPAQMFLTK